MNKKYSALLVCSILIPSAQLIAETWSELPTSHRADARSRSILQHKERSLVQQPSRRTLRRQYQQEKEIRKQKKKEQEEKRRQERKEHLKVYYQQQAEKRKKRKLEKAQRKAYLANLERVEEQRGINQALRLRKNMLDRTIKKTEWSTLRQQTIHNDYQHGRFAGLYKSPAWSYEYAFTDDKALTNINAVYEYATNVYNDRGKKADAAYQAFGYTPITLDDISLAYKLVRAEKLGVIDAQNNGYVEYYQEAKHSHALALLREVAGNDTITITPCSSIESLHTSLDLGRYIWGKQVFVGAHIPFMHVNHKLHLNITDQTAYAPGSNRHESVQKAADYILASLMQAKGITQYGGTATGIGDVALFLSAQTGARTFERSLVGLKVTFASGKDSNNQELWSPALGTGHTQFTAYASLLVDHHRFFNPHCSMQATYSMPTHSDMRVPVRVSKFDNNTMTVLNQSYPAAGGVLAAPVGYAAAKTVLPAATASVSSQALSLGGVVGHVNGTTFDEFDTSRKGLADQVHSVKIIRGMEFNLRIGNIIEKFIFRRGFLDIYYDLTVKASDAARGLNIQQYNLGLVTQDTNTRSHKLGIEMSVQCDNASLIKLGGLYTFSGHNAAQIYAVNAGIGYSF